MKKQDNSPWPFIKLLLFLGGIYDDCRDVSDLPTGELSCSLLSVQGTKKGRCM